MDNGRKYVMLVNNKTALRAYLKHGGTTRLKQGAKVTNAWG